MAAASTPALADIAGPALVIDGDTIEIAGRWIQLYGIDAPEGRQNCLVGVEVWLCGEKAIQALENFIGTAPVTCRDQGAGRDGYTMAICSVRDSDIAAWLVLNGWALADRDVALDYGDQERRARIAELGLWRGSFVAPWEWRRGTRLPIPPAPDNTDACLIKGDIAKSGEHVFHMPGGRYYDNTKINTATGERWFCTQAEAIAAGWRKARR